MKTKTQLRGDLTPRIREKSKELFGYEINQTELRLIPYLQYIMINEQRLDISRITGEERAIISKWREAGHIEGGASGMRITRKFWEMLCEIVFLGYVDIN